MHEHEHDPYLVGREHRAVEVVLRGARSAAILAVTPHDSDRLALHLELAAPARARCFHSQTMQSSVAALGL